MNIINNAPDIGALNKPEIERLQQEKQEYHLLGSFLRTRGMFLFGYNHLKDEVFKIELQKGETIEAKIIDGVLSIGETAAQKCTVDSRYTYFEAINLKNAIKRVEKYKNGKINELSNLRKTDDDYLSFF